MRDDSRGERADQDVLARVALVCQQALQPVGVDGAGVALVSPRGHRATVHATDDVAQHIEEAQFTLGEGPCVDATRVRSPVLVDDLTDRSQGVQDRWPGFLAAAAEAGVRAIFAFPLRIGAIAFGAVDVHRLAPGPLSAGQLRAALLTADALALLMLDLTTSHGLVGGAAVGSSQRLHFDVHGAAGMVKVQLGTTIENALARLRAVAFAQDRPIDEVAADVISGRLRFPEEDS